MMKLYGVPPTRALRAVWLLNELDLECEIIPANPLDLSPDLLALNPAAKVPILVDGDMVLPESSAIQLYLAEKYPNCGLIPTNLVERAQMYRWIFFLVTEIEQPLWRLALHTSIYPEAERVPEALPAAKKDCAKMVKVFEQHMKDREFVVGDNLTVADFNAAYTLDWASEAGMLDEAPALTAFVERMYKRAKAPQTIAEAFAALKN